MVNVNESGRGGASKLGSSLGAVVVNLGKEVVLEMKRQMLNGRITRILR
jgi:hypothetical protein